MKYLERSLHTLLYMRQNLLIWYSCISSNENLWVHVPIPLQEEHEMKPSQAFCSARGDLRSLKKEKKAQKQKLGAETRRRDATISRCLLSSSSRAEGKQYFQKNEREGRGGVEEEVMSFYWYVPCILFVGILFELALGYVCIMYVCIHGVCARMGIWIHRHGFDEKSTRFRMDPLWILVCALTVRPLAPNFKLLGLHCQSEFWVLPF